MNGWEYKRLFGRKNLSDPTCPKCEKPLKEFDEGLEETEIQKELVEQAWKDSDGQDTVMTIRYCESCKVWDWLGLDS